MAQKKKARIKQRRLNLADRIIASALTASTILTPLSAATMLVFSLLYTPCVAAVASIKRELGRGWAVGVVVWQCAVAWGAALLVRLVLSALGVA